MTPAIELACYPAMYWEGCRIIAVEEVQFRSSDFRLPGPQPDRIPWKDDLQTQPFPVRVAQRCDRQLSRIVVRIKSLLPSILVDHLTKVTLLVQESHTNDRDA